MLLLLRGVGRAGRIKEEDLAGGGGEKKNVVAPNAQALSCPVERRLRGGGIGADQFPIAARVHTQIT